METRPYILDRLHKGPASDTTLFDEVKLDCPGVTDTDYFKGISMLFFEHKINYTTEDAKRNNKNIKLIAKHGLKANTHDIDFTWSIRK